ncbi:FCD domain-containing protein, partial [Streptomyces nojiriensis]|uniref:FCD domain-containing protein n=1 Tax=Streptomyces nojiriensis TaxID=66374 RepID=UPI00364CC2A5
FILRPPPAAARRARAAAPAPPPPRRGAPPPRDLPGYAEADRDFHRAVLRLAGNDQLVQVAEELHRRAQWPLPGAPRVRRADLVADAAEHSALLEALIARDLPVVESLVREHFAGSPA